METLNSSGKSSSLMPPNVLPAWERLETGETAWDDFTHSEKDLIVRHYAPQIRFLALRLKAKLPKNIELGELISAGTLGLMEALMKFRADLGIRFTTYSENRIRGAMLDELRRLDWFPRSLRQKVRQIDNAILQLELQHGRQPSVEEIIEKTGMVDKDVQQGLEAMQCQIVLPLDSIEEVFAGEPQKGGEPFQGSVLAELAEQFAGLIDTLTEREKLVLSLYYVEELNMREVAEVMNVTEGRVSQLHSQAVARLRREFILRYGDDSPF